ncbi:MAG: RES family NAD+ phosphorylase [Caenispirillum bisanense]|nr:RES family NAD+ phosphorylase [Caenispirillum bisanense]MCA1971879.1 RES family NAD+ phosphorylase [Caenispirillum sp.]
MRLWRLSTAAFADAFDGGYGLVMEGRWNRLGQRITYTATVPSLCVLEKLVHIEDPGLLPDDLRMVAYDVPDDLPATTVAPDDLPPGWAADEGLSQQIGTRWYHAAETPLLRVPSAVVGLPGAPDRNVVVNNAHPLAARIRVAGVAPFTLDPRLLRS